MKKTEVDESQFIYVDVHWEDGSTNKRSAKWRRLRLEDVDKFQQENSNYNVFQTIQRFKNPVHTNPEVSYAPFYFDFDSSDPLLKLIENGDIVLESLENSLDPGDYIHLSNHINFGMPLESSIVKKIERKLKNEIWDINLDKSRVDVKKVVSFFKDSLALSEDDIHVYFSGKKGFHVLIEPVAIGVKPSIELQHIFKYIALFLMQELQLSTLDYKSIYSSRRMLRLVNSIHQGSRLFKVEITHAELETSVENIKNIAKQPRTSLKAPDYVAQARSVAVEWYEKFNQAFQASAKAKNKKIEIKDTEIAKMDNYPICVQDILDNSIKKSGDRNAATMALASYFKDSGVSLEDAESILVEWADKIPDDMTSSVGNIRKSSTITAIKTIYGSDNYHFACPFIRSLHGERKGSKYDPVKCGGRVCPLHDDFRMDNEPAEKVHLSETARSLYTGKKVSFDCLVSGKLDTPYIVPKKVNYICNNVNTCQKECIMHEFSGFYTKEFNEHERVLIEATHQNDNNLKNILKGYSYASCNKVGFIVEEYVNLEQVLVVPMAERVTSTGYNSFDERGRDYVSRTLYFVGDDVKTNQHYEFEGFVYPHPKNQFGTILSQKKTPKQDSVDMFNLTPEMIESFSVLQVQPNEDILARVDFILSDLTQNVTRIWEREEALLSVLLTYHSCLTFSFQGENQPRGWIETCLIGDSGQAKTHLVEKISDFIGLGDRASGESSSRTGLIYRMEQLGDRWFITWGKYPLNDRKLLIIDELTGMNEEDLGKMTEPRSTGVLRVDRVVNAETNARTRLIFLTNPRYGKQLFEFTRGIESLKTVFPEASDIRRLDLVVFLATKDVSKDILNMKYEKPEHQYISGEVLKNNVLWVWSRKPSDIQITKKAVDLILETAKYLGEKYGAAEDIPLVSPADQRIKLARLSIALAGLLHSTDAKHEKIVVKPEHVTFIKDYLEAVFDAPNCKYDSYARNAKDESEISEEEFDDVKKELDDLDAADSNIASKEILELFRRNDALLFREIMEMSGHDKLIVNARIALLSKKNFLKKTRNGFRKLPKFIIFLDQY